MKPPRVYKRGRYFWVQWWNNQKNDNDRTAILDQDNFSIEADILPPSKRTPPEEYRPDWWKESKHAKAIRAFIKPLGLKREKLANWEAVEKRSKDLKLDDLLRMYSARRTLKADPVSPHRVQSRSSAIQFLQQYGIKTVRQLTDERAANLRVRALKDYEASTVQKYFYDLKPMFDLAVKKRAIEENPFEDVRIDVPDKVIVAPVFEEEARIFDKLMQRPNLFEQDFYLRMIGCRGKDSCTLDLARLDFDNRVIDFMNNKGKREYLYPMPETVFLLLKDKKKLEWERSPKNLADKTFRWSGGAIRIHTLKSGFANEVQPYCTTDLLRNYVLHHKRKDMGEKFYLAPPVEEARAAINKAQLRWIEYLKDRFKTGTKPKRR